MAQNVRSVNVLLALGILAWLVAAIIALAIAADGKIILTCIAGAVLGFIGILYTTRRARKRGI